MGSLEKACFRSNDFVRGANLCWALGRDNLQFTPILPYFQHWEGWISTMISFRWANYVKTKKKVFTKNEHFFSPNSDEDQKNRPSPKMEHFFSPISSGHLRSDAHQSQTIGADADLDHIQTIGGEYRQIIEGYISPHPPGFRHFWFSSCSFYESRL